MKGKTCLSEKTIIEMDYLNVGFIIQCMLHRKLQRYNGMSLLSAGILCNIMHVYRKVLLDKPLYHTTPRFVLTLTQTSPGFFVSAVQIF